MTRINKTLIKLQNSGRKVLSPYLTAGDPAPELTVPLMHALVDAGADILEIGVPFSDPMAEGSVIQAAMERALSYGIGCRDVLNMIAEFRKTNNETPVVLMGYLNPIEQMGYDEFAKQARASGVDGTILVDLPPEESFDIQPVWEQHGLTSVYLCSPTTTEDRMALINECGQGYLYYVSLKGVTGSNSLDVEDVKRQYQKRKQQANRPIMVGFGIKTADMAAKIAEFADGVVVGAALVSEIQQAYSEKRDPLSVGSQLIKGMRTAMDNIESSEPI